MSFEAGQTMHSRLWRLSLLYIVFKAFDKGSVSVKSSSQPCLGPYGALSPPGLARSDHPYFPSRRRIATYSRGFAGMFVPSPAVRM